MKNNKTVGVFLIVFIVLTFVLSGYIVYEKSLENNNDDTINEAIDNNSNNDDTINEIIDNNSSNDDSNQIVQRYNYTDFEEKVYASSEQSYVITFWGNNTYSYYNDKGVSYFGTYTIDGDIITLLVLSGKNNNKEEVILKDTMTRNLKIVSVNEILDIENNVTILKANQPPRAGGFPRETFN